MGVSIVFMPKDVIFQGIFSITILTIIYYFYKIWPVDTERGRRYKGYLFNFRVKPENILQVILPTLVMIVITNFFILLMTDKSPSTQLHNPSSFLVGVLIQPFLEEVMFRGVLLGAILAFAEKFRTITKSVLILLGIIFIGYSFAEFHYISEVLSGGVRFASGEFLSKPGGVEKLVNSILYGLFFWWSGRNLSSSYAAHVTNNFIAFLYAYSVL